MPTVDENLQILQADDLNVFNNREPRRDPSIANLITGVANVLDAEMEGAATRNVIENTSQQIEDFSRGKDAQKGCVN